MPPEARETPEVLKGLLAALRQGQAVLLPTDTVYGLAVAPPFAPGPDVLYRLKGRPDNKPVAWLVGSADDLGRYGSEVPAWAGHLARAWWPGALTLVVKASPAVPVAYRSADGTIGLRMPDHPLVRALAGELGCALATTSANLSGRPAPQRFCDIDAALRAGVGAFVDAGAVGSGTASTVVDCTGSAPRVLREGDISPQALEQSLKR